LELGCDEVFQGVSIVEMSTEFDSDQQGRNRLAPDGSPDFDGESEPFEGRMPNAPPRGLMRKRRHPIFWIFLALLLGGFIALVLSALVTD
jgi:hypothetical protein